LLSLPDIIIFKALHLKQSADLQQVRTFSGYNLLIDTPSDLPGGSGQVGNWELAREAAGLATVFLAGGLTSENVQAAIKKVQPYGVDVSSGVEKSKGRKDPEKLKSFIAAVQTLHS
jgi:phosphoribosylanthranilate isomerase